MTLPLSTAADGEEDLMHGFDAAGYSQLPADHLSDSFESPSDDLTYDTPDVFSVSEAVMARHNSGKSDAESEGSPSHQNGGSVAHLDDTGNGDLIHNSNDRHDGGMDNQADPHNSNASHENGLHIDVRADNGVLYSNVGHDININHMQNHRTNIHDAAHGGHVVHIDGMEIHVYGQLAGLQLSAPSNHANISYEDAEKMLMRMRGNTKRILPFLELRKRKRPVDWPPSPLNVAKPLGMPCRVSP